VSAVCQAQYRNSDALLHLFMVDGVSLNSHVEGLFFFFFFEVLGFELRAYTLSCSTSPFFVRVFF
jgi:hypothetical protein